MTALVLATALARYSHPPMGLLCLKANLGAWATDTVIVETTLEEPPQVIAGRILARDPQVVGLSVHLWNLEPLTRVAEILRSVAPTVHLIAGGPEVGWQDHPQPLANLVDCLVAGEGETVLPGLVSDLIQGRPVPKVIQAPPPDLSTLATPYHLLTDHDLAHRLIYVEASRGCPFGCAYCTSARDRRMRRWPFARVAEDLSTLFARGARRFKFLDRSLNADPSLIDAILDVFLAHPVEDLHLELVPDRLTDPTRDRLARFPAGALHLELGVQSLSPTVLQRIGRPMDPQQALAILTWLRHHTGARLHADLIAGLPGETWTSLAAGFDALWAIGPHELQFGILKRLRDTPLTAMPDAGVFNPHPPYDLLANAAFSFADLQRLKHLARILDLFANHGRFPHAVTRLTATGPSPFAAWLAFADTVQMQEGRGHGISLERQRRLLAGHLITTCGVDPAEAERLVMPVV